MKKQLFFSIIAAITLVAISLKATTEVPVLAISNKDTSLIMVDISNGTDTVRGIGVGPGLWTFRNTPKVYIDMSTPKIRIDITPSDSKGRSTGYIIEAKGKTKYLTWNSKESPSLRPQKGRYMGLGKMIGMKTTDGLSLDNNVTSSEVREIK